MSSHYNLRSQRSALTASIENDLNTRSESSLTSVPTNYITSTVEESRDPHVDGPVLRPVRSYSDVVRTRADTPQPGAELVSASALSTEDTPVSYKTSVTPRSESAIKVLESPFMSSSDEDHESEVDAPWKTVERHHRRAKKANRKEPGKEQPQRVDLVRKAEKGLTEQERQRILDRKQIEENARSGEQTPSTLDEGPSKGKNIDPRNWGGADIDEAEMNVEAQREALLNWARTREWSRAVAREEPEGGSESGKDEGAEPMT